MTGGTPLTEETSTWCWKTFGGSLDPNNQTRSLWQSLYLRRWCLPWQFCLATGMVYCWLYHMTTKLDAAVPRILTTLWSTFTGKTMVKITIVNGSINDFTGKTMVKITKLDGTNQRFRWPCSATCDRWVSPLLAMDHPEDSGRCWESRSKPSHCTDPDPKHLDDV